MTASTCRPRRRSPGATPAAPNLDEPHRWRPVRSLHLIDLENLAGGWLQADHVRMVWDCYTTAIGIQPGDGVIVALDRHLTDVFFQIARPDIQLRAGSGPDGADRALTDAIDIRHAATRYNAIIIASGDHHFCEIARQARGLGMAVWQVTGYGRRSAELAKVSPLRLRLHLPAEADPETHRATVRRTRRLIPA